MHAEARVLEEHYVPLIKMLICMTQRDCSDKTLSLSSLSAIYLTATCCHVPVSLYFIMSNKTRQMPLSLVVICYQRF
jgi:hypothetical protein